MRQSWTVNSLPFTQDHRNLILTAKQREYRDRADELLQLIPTNNQSRQKGQNKENNPHKSKQDNPQKANEL
jgi:hypothetical protein